MYAPVTAGVPLPALIVPGVGRPVPRSRSPVRLLAIVEGIHDAAFLRSIASVLHAADAEVLDLALLEASGQLVFVPRGGDLAAWAERFAPLGIPEFHLADRELEPETTARQRATERIATRLDCRAFLTTKRSIENYLHPEALVAAGGPRIEIGDDDPVAEILAERFQARHALGISWRRLPHRVRKRWTARAKRWLVRHAVPCMTAERLAERDPAGEVAGWLRAIADLLNPA